VVTELLPFGVGRLAVFLAGAAGTALVDVASVVTDDFLWIDRDVALGGIEIEVAQQFRGDVDR